ncbi:hypothetical protein SH584_11250 [Sphingomonas sp. LY29]|uniref:hypothetical protein n=1 Tax=Sphingomonas sp. LY29 TaxID=3095341 RepID=UPI002D78B8FE|nr:hypothetical protein [Sphingomonas sp. LY29]WRP25608.1 hypothetical protein SH584_11250 [Sphingomonas sp. LY29]
MSALLMAFAGTIVVGVASRFLLDAFAASWPSRIAAFCIAIGFALGRFQWSGPASAALIPLATAGGAVMALFALYLWLIRPLRSRGSDTD